MAKRKKAQPKKETKPSKFLPEIRQALARAVASGATREDAAHMAGIGASTFFLWLAIGKAVRDGKSHKNMPPDEETQQAYLEFVEEIEKAGALNKTRSVTTIIQAGQERWVHRDTGTIRLTPPPPMTYMNKLTGNLVFDSPFGLGEDDQWAQQLSGNVWQHIRGQWQALAWFLERSDPEHWAMHTKLEVAIDTKILKQLDDAMTKRGLSLQQMLLTALTRLTSDEQ